MYEPTVLNPYNFSAICMLEHGLPYFPESLRIKQMLIKLYAKLGLARTVTHYCKSVTPRPDKTIFTATKDFERLGAQRFSTVSGYGDQESLEELVSEYCEYFPKKVLGCKNELVQKYTRRNFEDIHSQIQTCEQFEANVLWQHFKVARAAAFIQNQSHLLDSAKTFAYFNKQFGDIDAISEAEAQPEFRFTPPETPIDPKVRTNLIGKELKPLKLGLSRDDLKAAALIETSYQTGADEKWHT